MEFGNSAIPMDLISSLGQSLSRPDKRAMTDK